MFPHLIRLPYQKVPIIEISSFHAGVQAKADEKKPLVQPSFEGPPRTQFPAEPSGFGRRVGALRGIFIQRRKSGSFLEIPHNIIGRYLEALSGWVGTGGTPGHFPQTGLFFPPLTARCRVPRPSAKPKTGKSAGAFGECRTRIIPSSGIIAPISAAQPSPWRIDSFVTE